MSQRGLRVTVLIWGLVLWAAAAVLGPAESAARSGLPGGNGKIAFVSYRDTPSGEIYTMDADGLNVTRLINDSNVDATPAWSPDGSKIAFASQRGANWDIYVMNSDGTGVTRLTTNAADDKNPAWSPDGRKIVFNSARGGNDDIYVMNSDGTSQAPVDTASASDVAPAWSPDSTRVAFESQRGGNPEVWVINTDGTGATDLTNNLDVDEIPTWSPDGSKIAFASYRDGDYEIFTMNADGTGQTQITSNISLDNHPAWSPDGSKIAFYSNRDGNEEIYVMNSSGTGQTNLTSNSADDKYPAWQPIPNDRELTQASASPGTVRVGEQATYTFKATNNGPASAPGVMVSVSLPASMDPLSIASTQGTCQLASISCNVGTLTVGASTTITVVARAVQAGTATAQGTVGAWGADESVANDQRQAQVEILPAEQAAPPGSSPPTTGDSPPTGEPPTTGEPSGGVPPKVSLKMKFPKRLKARRTTKLKRRALYRAVARGFKGRVQGATRLAAGLVRKRGRACRRLDTAKKVSCSKTSRKGMRARARSGSLVFTYKPLGRRKLSRRLIRRGTYRLIIKAFPETGRAHKFVYTIRAA